MCRAEGYERQGGTGGRVESVGACLTISAIYRERKRNKSAKKVKDTAEGSIKTKRKSTENGRKRFLRQSINDQLLSLKLLGNNIVINF